MIMTHNSFTYLKANNPILEAFSFLWRCQDKTLDKQIAAGARVLDIRVRIRRSNGKHSLRLCHGIVELDSNGFLSVRSIAAFVKSKGMRCRFVLERGDCVDKCQFEIQLTAALRDYSDTILFAAIKSPWEVLYAAPEWEYGTDYSYVPWNTGKSLWWNLRHFRLSTIRRWAAKHNPTGTELAGLYGDSAIHTLDML